MQGAAGESSSQASTGISHLARPTVACERAPGTHSSASARRRRRGGCSAGGCWCRVGRARLLTRKRMLRLGAPRRVVRCYHRRLPCSLSRWEDGSGRPTVLPSPSPHGPRPSLLLGCWCRELDGRTRGLAWCLPAAGLYRSSRWLGTLLLTSWLGKVLWVPATYQPA